LEAGEWWQSVGSESHSRALSRVIYRSRRVILAKKGISIRLLWIQRQVTILQPEEMLFSFLGGLILKLVKWWSLSEL
jgi:hypothetical protein